MVLINSKITSIIQDRNNPRVVSVTLKDSTLDDQDALDNLANQFTGHFFDVKFPSETTEIHSYRFANVAVANEFIQRLKG